MNLDPMNIIYRSKGALTPESMRQADRLRYEEATRKWNAEHGTKATEQTGEAEAEAELTADEKQALIDQLKAEKARLEAELKEMETADTEATEKQAKIKAIEAEVTAHVKDLEARGFPKAEIARYWMRTNLAMQYEKGIINVAEYKNELSNLHKKQ